ncbi:MULTISPECIES: PleD family two-component system response regulator [Sphingobacterium]|uniref:response regulator n=1 Tax=Sphingobacterium TaxID=28453 RepID=UPI001F08F1A9|nr:MULTISPECIES: response regulator [unclassified Sphingobacterium]
MDNPEKVNPVILIVEDNKEILAYLNKELKGHYTILRAGNGAEALDILDANDVQLVLTDILMPIMDGITLCRRIKSDILYSHIPLIFLTAKNSLDAKIEGLNIGADAYIEKPFSLEYLLVNISNLLTNRERLLYGTIYFKPIGHACIGTRQGLYTPSIQDHP